MKLPRTVGLGDRTSRHYLLIAGAWHGGWVWQPVVAGLRAAGREASSPTLTGLGERRHLGGNTIDLDTHVEDVVAHIEMEDLSDITLVGWSYGGMIVPGVLARAPNRVRALIYLDAFVPEDGKAMVDSLSPEGRTFWDKYRDSDTPVPPFSMERLGVTEPEQIDFVAPRLVPHPWRTVYQPVKAAKSRPDIPTSYIRCSRNAAPHFDAAAEKMRKEPGVRVETIDAGHACMVTAPEETIRILLALDA